MLIGCIGIDLLCLGDVLMACMCSNSPLKSAGVIVTFRPFRSLPKWDAAERQVSR